MVRRVSGRAWALALLAAGCGRQFAPPRPAPGAARPTVEAVEPPAGFAGDLLTVRGHDWGEQTPAVRLGQSFAAVRLRAPGELEVTMPDLGLAPQTAPLVLLAGGAAAAGPEVRYRGPGHVEPSAVEPVCDLSPRPVLLAAHGGQLAVVTVGQDQLEVLEPSQGNQYTWFADPGIYPLGLSLPQAGGAAAWELGHHSPDFDDPAVLGTLAFPEAPAGSYAPRELPGVRVAEALVGQGGPVVLGPAPDGGRSVLPPGPVLCSALTPEPAAPGVDLLAALTQDGDGGLTLACWELAPDGGAQPLSAQPVGGLEGYAPQQLALSPDLRRAVVLAQSSAGSRVVRVDLTPTPGWEVVYDPGLLMGFVAAGVDGFVVSELSRNHAVRLRRYDGQLLAYAALDSSLSALTRDLAPPYHYFGAMPDPPLIYEFAPEDLGRSLVQDLAAGLYAAAFSPSGRLAVATYLPCSVAVLEPGLIAPARGAFSSAPPGVNSTTPLISELVWAGEAMPCGLVSGARVACHPSGALLGPEACTLPSPSPGALQMLAADAQGGVYVISGARALRCEPASGCPQSCPPAFPDGRLSARLDAVRFSADGHYAVGTDTEDAELRILCYREDGADPPPLVLPGAQALGLALSPTAPLAVVVGHPGLAVVVDLRTGQEAARLDLLGLPPGAVAWSPDGRRVYVGALTGEVLAYDVVGLEAAPAGGLLVPERSVVGPIPVSHLLADPAGARLLTFWEDEARDLLRVVR